MHKNFTVDGYANTAGFGQLGLITFESREPKTCTNRFLIPQLFHPNNDTRGNLQVKLPEVSHLAGDQSVDWLELSGVELEIHFFLTREYPLAFVPSVDFALATWSVLFDTSCRLLRNLDVTVCWLLLCLFVQPRRVEERDGIHALVERTKPEVEALNKGK